MNREQIYEQLNEMRHEIARREYTPRVMQPVDFLLDQLIEIQHDDALELLLDLQEVGHKL